MLNVFLRYLCMSLQYFDTLGWVFWKKNRRPYTLYSVIGDVKPCSINQSINQYFDTVGWVIRPVKHLPNGLNCVE